MRLINVEDYPYKEHQIDYENGNEHFIYGLKTMQEWIDKQPTVDAELVKHGRWLLEREPDGKPYCLHCSVCDGDFSNISIMQGYDYCPNCGAKMDLKEEK